MSNYKRIGVLKFKNNDFGNPTLGTVNYTSSCVSDGSLETDLLLQSIARGSVDMDLIRSLSLCSDDDMEVC